MLTLENFNKIPHGEIFAEGKINDGPTGINIARTEKVLHWVAKKGGGNDWAIYVGVHPTTSQEVASHGDKVTSEYNIKKLIPCDDEVFGRYRY